MTSLPRNERNENLRQRAPAVAILHPKAVDAALDAEEAQLAPEGAPRVAHDPVGNPVLLAPARHLRACAAISTAYDCPYPDDFQCIAGDSMTNYSRRGNDNHSKLCARVAV